MFSWSLWFVNGSVVIEICWSVIECFREEGRDGDKSKVLVAMLKETVDLVIDLNILKHFFFPVANSVCLWKWFSCVKNLDFVSVGIDTHWGSIGQTLGFFIRLDTTFNWSWSGTTHLPLISDHQYYRCLIVYLHGWP